MNESEKASGQPGSEERQRRDAALQHAPNILLARQRAEREPLGAQELLEQRTRELAESLAMTRATLEATFDGILATDGRGQITAFNEKYLRLWQIPRELIDTHDHRRVLELCARQLQDPAAFLARVDEVEASGWPQTTDTLELADGRVYERISTIRYIDGRAVGRVWSMRDITANRRAESELRRQREWLQITLASIGDAVVTTDIHAHVTFMNPVAERMTGWPSSEAVGSPVARIFELVDEYTGARLEHPIARVLREGVTITLANPSALLTRDGTSISIEDSAAPIRDAADRMSGAVMVFHDVTARRRAEAALREADRRKDEFLATLAHELRNPLAPIRQAALIARASSASEAQKHWSHNVIDRQVHHMSLLLDDLLDISRVTRGTLVLRRQPTDLASAIDAAVETARPLIDTKRHTLTVQCPCEPVRLHADPLRVAQVLCNLLTNAAKYTDPGGRISIVARGERSAAVIDVADTGIGIDAGALPRVFDMFAQIKSARDRSEGGLGIGLALAKALVQLHQGSIEAHSAGAGRGSRFTVRLPLVTEAAPSRDDAAHAASARNGPQRRVLIADDNHDSAETMAQLLRLEGHEVITVHDGAEALVRLRDFAPDAALLDIGMPRLDGYQVARQLRDAGAAVKLIAVTGWGQEDDRQRALRAGFDHHLTKPVDFDQLARLLRQ